MMPVLHVGARDICVLINLGYREIKLVLTRDISVVNVALGHVVQRWFILLKNGVFNGSVPRVYTP